MIELSATVTVGAGSESHNHDLEYRSTLEHVHSRPEGVIELLPYNESYQNQINAAVKPYIDQYNEAVDARYQAAWERYNSGLIKTKPRKRDFKKMDYDYYSEHLHDTFRNPRTKKMEELPMWRSFIIGIGDQEDRQQERITEQQARKIFAEVFQDFKNDFPQFLILGAALHLDEQGFYHMHVDYKPLYEKESSDNARGLAIGIGLDAALENMGFKPEQSIINGQDKIPLLFNAMRNQIYYRLEKAMASEGLRMQYGVSKVKDPGKDSSKNQRLEDWQATQDTVRTLQHQKNLIISTMTKDYVSDKNIASISALAHEIFKIIKEVDNSPRSRVDKNKRVVEFHLLDQLHSFVQKLVTYVGSLLNQLKVYSEKLQSTEKELQNYKDKEAAGGKYYSDLDIKIIKDKVRSEISDDRAKTERLEKYLRKLGIPQQEIDFVKNSPEKKSSWGGSDN